jgi:D-sedoheptulose 7-phosphate isomerase
MKNKIIYCFDLDNTICHTIDKNYKNSYPYEEMVNKINELYDSGNKIIIYTARGGTSKIDYHELNITQLKNWGVKYHELIDKNKPHFDLFIDDKAINAQTWREQNNIKIPIMNVTTYIQQYLTEVKQIADLINQKDLDLLISNIKKCQQQNGRIFVVGVGGSAANAAHAVNDFRKICNIETYSVSENVAELTARINDVGWDTCYSEWLKTSRIDRNDILLVFSVGGGSDTTSQNLVKAMEYSKERRSTVLSVVSRDGGKAKQLSDVCLLIPVVDNSRITPHAEEWQGIVLHLIVNGLSYEY